MREDNSNGPVASQTEQNVHVPLLSGQSSQTRMKNQHAMKNTTSGWGFTHLLSFRLLLIREPIRNKNGNRPSAFYLRVLPLSHLLLILVSVITTMQALVPPCYFCTLGDRIVKHKSRRSSAKHTLLTHFDKAKNKSKNPAIFIYLIGYLPL